MSKIPNTKAHPDLVGNGSLAQVFTQHFSRAGATTNDEYMMGISYVPEVYAGSSPAVTPTAGTIQVAGSGIANTATIVLRVENKDAAGSANSDVSFTITVAAAKVGWSSGAASAYTLKDVIDLINEDDAGGTSGKLLSGFKAWIMDAPYDFPINAASALVNMSETYIAYPGNTREYTKALQRDLDVHVIDSDLIRYKRIGFPESRDRGLFKFVDLFGTVTGTTNGALRIYRDDVDDFVAPTGTYATDIANHEVLYYIAPASVSANRGTTAGVAAGKATVAETWRGPCIIEVKSDDVSAVDLRIAMQAVSF